MPEPGEMTPDPELAALLHALRDMAPASGNLSRDRLLFEAGRASMRSAQRWVWPAAAAGFALLSVVFAGVLASEEPRVLVVERDVPVHVQASSPPPPVRHEAPAPRLDIEPSPAQAPAALAQARDDDHAADARRMAALRRDVLRWGADMLPEPRPARNAAPAPHDPELEDGLRPTPGAFASPYGFFFPPTMPGGNK